MLRSRRTLWSSRPIVPPSPPEAGQATSAEALEALEALMDAERRGNFVAKLFGGQATDFEEFIKKLEGIPSWSLAYHLIEDEFHRRNIPLHQREAILFTNLIYKRYFPKDRNVKIEE